jgi:hypothetical protein
MFNSRRRCHRNLRISRPVLPRTSWCTSFHSSNNWHCSSGFPHRTSLVWQTSKRWNRTPRNHSQKFELAPPPATNGSPSELWVRCRRNPRFEPYSVEFRYVVSETDILTKRTGRTYEVDYGHCAFRFIRRRWLDQISLASEHGIKFGRLENFIDLDRLRRALKFASILFAFFLQPSLAHEW